MTYRLVAALTLTSFCVAPASKILPTAWTCVSYSESTVCSIDLDIATRFLALKIFHQATEAPAGHTHILRPAWMPHHVTPSPRHLHRIRRLHLHQWTLWEGCWAWRPQPWHERENAKWLSLGQSQLKGQRIWTTRCTWNAHRYRCNRKINGCNTGLAMLLEYWSYALPSKSFPRIWLCYY